MEMIKVHLMYDILKELIKNEKKKKQINQKEERERERGGEMKC